MLDMDRPIDELRYKLADKYWRMNNLYYIIDKYAQKVKFKFNPVQEQLYQNNHPSKIILKSRQHGVSTYCDIDILDDALFEDNISCGIIADNLDDAKKLLETKVIFPYENLPEMLKEARQMDISNKMQVGFDNKSSIWVDTSVRSATVHRLHISEFGKICAKTPDKAQEIVTGCFNAIQPGQKIYIESTAEGREGYFYDYCQTAQNLQLEKRDLTSMDFHFFFFAWWQDVGNVLTKEEVKAVIIESSLTAYFKALETGHKIILSLQQKAWYVKKLETQQDKMKQEHPSTPEEAFEEAIQGAYYKRQFQKIREEKRITKVPHDVALMVNTYWDLGIDDATCILFTQDFGREVRIINYYENSGEGLAHYASVLNDLRKEHNYMYNRHIAPFDINVRDLSTGKSRLEAARSFGINFQVCARLPIQDGIEAVRRILPQCIFDEEKCGDAIKALEQYRKEWDERLGKFRDKPLHDWSCHAADAFRVLAVSHNFEDGKNKGRRKVKTSNSQGWT